MDERLSRLSRQIFAGILDASQGNLMRNGRKGPSI